jgi:hypothetical protein
MRSASTSSSFGNGPSPNIPFSLYNVILTPGSKKLALNVGIPIPKFTYIPSLISLAALLAILSLYSFPSPLPPLNPALPESTVLNSILF